MLHRSNTNTGDRTGGSTWGFEGNNLFILIGALLPAMYLGVTLWRNGYGWPLALVAGLILPILACAYIFGFKQGKPQAFDVDLLEEISQGQNWHHHLKRRPPPLYNEPPL